MKNNEWNVPSDYFEKNKKALLPVRKFPTGKWLLALAAACAVGVGVFKWKGEDQTQEVAKVQKEEKVREGKRGEDIGSKHLSPEMEDVGSKNLSPRIAEELKEIPREELVAYLLEEDSDFIENID